MSPPNTSHEAGEAEEAGGAYDVDETTRLLLGLPSLVVTVGGATSTATSCCSSACNSPKTDRYYSNDDDRGRDRDRASQFLPSLLRPQSQPHPTSSSLQLPSHSPSPYPRDHHQHHHHHLSPRSAASPFPIVASSVRSVFSDIHSECELSKQEIHNESEFYLRSSIVARAFPERMFALTVTLIFEIPVLLMISGGSDALCQLVGRTKYQLLMGFIPLTSAISGNVGLQASTLTTRAISHDHVTPSKYLPWFGHEVGAACVLGLGMGTLLATIAFFASLYDVAFALTIFVAQFISIVTAGCTGTFAPLLFSFIFRRDSGKWGGPLETAIQDIVGSFAMVIISYRILLLLGAGPVDPNDVCSAVTADNVGR